MQLTLEAYRTRAALAELVQLAFELKGGVGNADPLVLRGKKMGQLLVDDGPELNQTLRHEHVRGKVCEACSAHDRTAAGMPMTANSGENADAADRPRNVSPAILEFQIQTLKDNLDLAETRAKTAEQLNAILKRKLERFGMMADEVCRDVDTLLSEDSDVLPLKPAA